MLQALPHSHPQPFQEAKTNNALLPVFLHHRSSTTAKQKAKDGSNIWQWKGKPVLSLLQETLALPRGTRQGREQCWLPPHWGGDAGTSLISFLHPQPARLGLITGISGAAIRVITTETPAAEAALGFSLMH